MTMRPPADARGGLNHLVDTQIGRAFPVVHKVYQHLDAIEYIAQIYEAGRSRDIVLRTNHTKEWIEWQYKGEPTWTILFKFSDLLGSVTTKAGEAAASATNAATSAGDASTKAGEALASANAAAASASTATTKATEAAESASTATTQAVIATERATQALAIQNAAADYAAVSSASAALANDWATKTSSEVVPGQGFGAKKYALDAEQSAINAETSFQSSVNAAQVLVDGFRTYRTVSTSLPSGVPRQGEEWIVVQ